MKSQRFCLLTDQINVEKFHLLKNTFRPVGKVAMAFGLKKCCTAKGRRFRYLNKNHFRT